MELTAIGGIIQESIWSIITESFRRAVFGLLHAFDLTVQGLSIVRWLYLQSTSYSGTATHAINRFLCRFVIYKRCFTPTEHSR